MFDVAATNVVGVDVVVDGRSDGKSNKREEERRKKKKKKRKSELLSRSRSHQPKLVLSTTDSHHQ